jgi:hypothetical protein
MPNNFVFPAWVAMEPLRLIKNKKVVTESFDTRYQKEFEKDFAVGETVSVKLPQRFIPVDGMGYQPQGINRVVTTVTLDQWIQIAVRSRRSRAAR